MKRITRTIEKTVATVLFANVDKKEFDEKEVELIGTFESEKECLTNVERMGEFVPVAITATKRIVKRYAIPVEDFVKYATEISVNDTEEDEENA